MTKRYLAFALALVPVLILAGAPTRAAALGSDNLNVKVPFPFVVGQSLLPAGRYQVHAGDLNPAIIWLVSSDGRHVANVATEWGGSMSNGSQPKLLFKVYGNTHFLSQVRIPGENGRTVAVTRGEVQSELARLAARHAGTDTRPRS